MTWHLPDGIDRMQVNAALATLTERWDRAAANVMAYAFKDLPESIEPEEFINFLVCRITSGEFMKLSFRWSDLSDAVPFWLLHIQRSNLEPIGFCRFVLQHGVDWLGRHTWKETETIDLFVADGYRRKS